MRLYFLLALLAVLATVVLAWEKEDHEIFDLVSALEATEGKGTTFYSWLDVPPTATTPEIAKAYRKLSIKMHPDKNPGVKASHERFARLGVISNILRNKESRRRYDFFYKNGVPRWRGTGYYYSRFRPGLGTVLIFLTIFTSALQLLVQKMNYKKDLSRIELITSRAKRAAWGPKMTPTSIGQRKIRVNLGEQHDEDGFIEGSKFIEMIVEGHSVYIQDDDGMLHPVNNSTATRPSISNTWFIALMKHLFAKVTSKKENMKETSDKTYEVDGPEIKDVDDTSSIATSGGTSGTSTPREDSGKGSSLNIRGAPVEKAGGKRRRVPKRR